MDQILQWFEANAGKIIFLLVAIVAALLITKGLARVMRKVLDRTDMPSASIFINIMRVLVWILAASIVLQPVFGISPTTLMTALGVGGIAVSLGLKDTVANVISGFGLMLGKVIQPGDLVSVAGTMTFTAKAGSDPAHVTEAVKRAVATATVEFAQLGSEPLVKLTGFSPYGIEVQALAFTRDGVFLSTMRDAMARAIAGCEFVEQRAAVGE